MHPEVTVFISSNIEIHKYVCIYVQNCEKYLYIGLVTYSYGFDGSEYVTGVMDPDTLPN